MRSKAYNRAMRRKHIARKKKIAKKLYGSDYYKADGMYDKGKVHCSCPMCTRKTNNKGKNRLKHGNYFPSKDWKHSDQQKLDQMDWDYSDYNEHDCDISYARLIEEDFSDSAECIDYFYEQMDLDELLAEVADGSPV